MYDKGLRDQPGKYYLSFKKFYFDVFFNKIFVKFLFKIGFYDTYIYIDRGILEAVGPRNISKNIVLFSNLIIPLQTGLYVNYIHYIFSFLIVLFFYFSFIISIYFLLFFLLIILLDIKKLDGYLKYKI